MNERGFTIPELIIAITVSSILSLTLLTIILSFYGGVVRANISAKMTVDAQIILRNIVDELRVSSGVLATNLINDDNGPIGGWQTDNNTAVLIMSTPAVDAAGDFITDPLTGEPYQNEIIYFASNGNLYKRILGNTDAPENVTITTCPAAEASSSCPLDPLISEDYESLSFSFFDQDNAATLVESEARSVDMIINLNRQIFGKDVEAVNSVRVTLRNSLS